MANISKLMADLSAEFPREQVSWRSQSLTKEGTKAMALCYIDARDVMRRLDNAVGPENWSDEYVETVKGRIICTIKIHIDGMWISKSDGAGDSDVEAEKGAISDAFKRAAVKWGIGRYLYDLPSPWVACTSYEKNGKKYWNGWSADPWKETDRLMKRESTPSADPKAEQPKLAPKEQASTPLARCAKAMTAVKEAKTEAALRKLTDSPNYQALLVDLHGMEERGFLMNAVTERYQHFLNIANA